MEEIVYLSIRFGCTAYLLYKVWKQKERIGKICDLLYTPRNRPQAEKDNGEPGNAQDVMGATRFVYLDENAGKTVDVTFGIVGARTPCLPEALSGYSVTKPPNVLIKEAYWILINPMLLTG